MVLTTRYPKNKIRPLAYIIHKYYQKRITDLIYELKLLNFSKKKLSLNDPGLCKVLLDMTPKAHNERKKQINWTS